ncbi:MAG: 2-amino-4-hydroxy-6-hydroxymethyldihydropteridine diphosphokinase [Treponema sp. CETP13]|nr:MAG: 2-amino-4-hydroxy-6-hydroxymethyldihydropteridine diphosphokinase [Treponema sp. CETP13]
MHFVVLGLGSNRAFCELQPLEILKKACSDLNVLLEDCILSSVYNSKPMYVEDQDDFYNMVVAGVTDLSPFELLKTIHKIEEKWGRNRKNEIRNGPRSLDIDIELFGNKTIHTKDLVIPHEHIRERQFVLIPLIEILNSRAFVKLEKERKYTDIPQRTLYYNYLSVLKEQGVKKYCSPFA